MFISASTRLEAKKIFLNCTGFCLFICVFVFASNSGYFRINDVLLFLAPLFLLNYILFTLHLFLQKSGGGGGRLKPPPAPPSAQSLLDRTCMNGTVNSEQ